MGRGCREQQQPHVGWRSSMCDDGDRVFLKIIRRQPVVFRANESLKKAPGAPNNHSRELIVLGVEEFSFRKLRFADPIRDGGRNTPGGNESAYHRKRSRIEYQRQTQSCQGEQLRRQHEPEEGAEVVS